MSEIKALEKLRGLPFHGTNGFGTCVTASKETVNSIADEIEAEIEREWMRLPTDADNVPIHVGDVLRSASSKTEYTALGFWFDFDCDIWQVMVSSKQAMSGNMLRHVKPRTLEDVLVEYAETIDVTSWKKAHDNRSLTVGEWEEIVCSEAEKYADEIRELLGGDAE